MQEERLLDLVITDEQFIENIDFQAPLGKSDHSVLLISCNVNPSAYYLTKKYAFSKGDYTGLRNSLQSVARGDLLLAHVDNVDDMWEVFKNELLNRIETFIPKMMFRPWPTPNQQTVSSCFMKDDQFVKFNNRHRSGI